MSDHFWMLVDTAVEMDSAESTCAAVIGRFRQLGLIDGQANRDCALGGDGYRPARGIVELYQLGENEPPFWELVTCGVEPHVGRAFNYWAWGPAHEWYACPSCGGKFDLLKPRDEGPSTAIKEWNDQSGLALMTCSACRQTRPITEWVWRPPLGFGNLSFRFWNWPSPNSPAWKIDIIAAVREVTDHNIVLTWGHI